MLVHQNVLLLTILLPTLTAKKLIYEENFDTIDAKAWHFDIGGNGWGNEELEYYTNRTQNARAENGILIIEARRENYGNRNFTSARMLSNFSFKYGTFESRIKIPSITKGLWPAWWLLGTDSPQWPDCGEIDVFEYGYPDYTNSFFTYGIHEAGPGAWGQVETNKDQSTDFHVYRVDWNVTDIVFYLDDKQYGQFNITEHDTFHKPFYFLLDLAIGGTLPEIYDPKQITAKLPAQMLVDYIRVWQGERSTGMSHLVYML